MTGPGPAPTMVPAAVAAAEAMPTPAPRTLLIEPDEQWVILRCDHTPDSSDTDITHPTLCGRMLVIAGHLTATAIADIARTHNWQTRVAGGQLGEQRCPEHTVSRPLHCRRAHI